MNRDSSKQVGYPQLAPESDDVMSLQGQGLRASDLQCDAIRLDDCSEFDRIAVRTRMSEYELIVLSVSGGDVLVRGGRYFPEFRRARLSGSTFGGSSINLRTIEVGGCLELYADGKPIVTSAIRTVSHVGVRDRTAGAISLCADAGLNSPRPL